MLASDWWAMVNNLDECSSDYDLVSITKPVQEQKVVCANKVADSLTPATRPGHLLTWNFFDQVSILDNQLRNEEHQEKLATYLDPNDASVNTTDNFTMGNTKPQQSPSLDASRQSPPLIGDILWNNNHHVTTTNSNSVNRKNHNNNYAPKSAASSSSNGKRVVGSIIIDGDDFPHFRHDDAMRLDGSIARTNQRLQQGHHATSGGTVGGGSAKIVTGTSKMGAGDTARMGSAFQERMDYNLGLVGWRKKCLFTLILVLMLLIIVNLVLTLWILKVMEFSSEGMGQLRIVPGGIQLTGQTLVMDLLRASTIRSRHGQPISIESSRNFSINTRDRNGILENHLFLGHDKLECLSSGFGINDTTGRSLFSVNRNEVTIGAHSLRIDGEGGAIFRESVQTPHVRAEAGRELRLESPTRQLEISAAKDVNLQSRAGGLEMSALDDIKLSALAGSIRLESPIVIMPNLRTAQPPLPGAAQSRDHLHRVFQLCACSNGKLFLASPHSVCAGDDSTVCR